MERLKKIIRSEWSYRLIKFLYVFLFFYAGVAKLLDPQSLAIVIDAYGLVPDAWVMPIAVLLPAVEVAAAMGLLLDVRGSISLVAGLLCFFLVIVGYGLWLGLDIDCGCFGSGDPEGDAYKGLRPAFFRNIILMVGVVYLYYWRYTRPGGTAHGRFFFERIF